MRLPVMNNGNKTRLFTEEFRGINYAERPAENEFSEAVNMTSDDYPVLSVRKIRKHHTERDFNEKVVGVYSDVEIGLVRIIERRVLLVTNTYILIGDDEFKISTSLGSKRRNIVRMGVYLIVFPDGFYINTANTDDYGRIGVYNDSSSHTMPNMPITAEEKAQVMSGKTFFQSWNSGTWSGQSAQWGSSLPSTGTDMQKFMYGDDTNGYHPRVYDVDATADDGTHWLEPLYIALSLVDENGEPFHVDYLTANEPSSPTEGQLWLNSKDGALQKWYTEESMWSIIPTYVKLRYNGIGEGLIKGDSIELFTDASPISSSSASKANIPDSVVMETLKGNKEIISSATDYIIFKGTLPRPFMLQFYTLENTSYYYSTVVERPLPTMDYAIECENRLWGCRYDIATNTNSVYACKLGDFRNWISFGGISTDAWEAVVGYPGEFTGAVTLGNSPIFFKENNLLKIYISATGAHQINAVSLDGVQEDCDESAVVLEGILYYKGNKGFYAYDGSYPVIISEALGRLNADRVRAAVAYEKIYFVCRIGGAETIYVYDTKRRLWHHELFPALPASASSVEEFVVSNADKTDAAVYYSYLSGITRTNAIYSLTGTEWEDYDGWEEESNIQFEAVTPVIGYSYPDNKYLSRFDLRMKLYEGATVSVLIQYNSDGVWHSVGAFSAANMVLDTFTLPIVPRRCDHLQIKMTGMGQVKLYSFARYLEQGSDVR